MVMDFWIDQETHRHSHHNQADENWIVTINQEDSLILSFFINGMVKLTKVIHKEVDHDDKVKDRVDREIFKCKKICKAHNHLTKSDDN